MPLNGSVSGQRSYYKLKLAGQTTVTREQSRGQRSAA